VVPNDVKRSSSPPRPEVQYLPTLFRRMSTGEIRIPAFQRTLVWTNEQIRALFESVYKGYPIGSVLLWKAASEMFEPYIPENVHLPHGEASASVMYVLDGMQRLISLFAAFNGGGGPENRFELVFDLREQTFLHDLKGRRSDDPMYLKLSRVFVPRLFVQDQAQLAKLDDADKWLNRAVELHSRFQEYLMPIVTIEGASVDEAVEIFTNINREGLSLSTIDFMRALTWRGTFDLNAAVAQVRDALPVSFSPGDESIAKVIALMLDIDPLPDSILRLRELSAENLNDGVARATRALKGVARFLKDRLGIASAEFVPYEGQLLVLVALYGLGPLDEDVETHLVKWFVATSFSETFQGRPDHAIVQMVKAAVDSLRSGELNLDIELVVNPDILAKKQLRKGTAVSAGLLALLSLNNARSITNATIINRSDYLDVFDPALLGPIVRTTGDQRVRGNVRRQVVNLVLLSAEESYGGIVGEDIAGLLHQCSDAVLRSQLLDEAALRMLKEGSVDNFLLYRTMLITANIRALLAAPRVPAIEN
jgi:hypothetical protein